VNTENTQPGWRVAGTLGIGLLLLMLVLYQHTVIYLTGFWNQFADGNYAHGYLVLAISAYLVLKSRQRLFSLAPCPEYRALLLVVAASMLWMVAALVYVEVVQAVALWLLVLASVWAVFGNQVFRLLAFPVIFIIFAIPAWFPLSPVLQNLTADGVFTVIRLLSVPALRQENMIVLPAGTLSIEEACGGLSYLLAALTLGTLYAHLNYKSLRARVLVVLISAGSAILSNMIRVFIVVYLGYTTDMQHPLIHDHLALGWYLFGGLVIMLLVIDTKLYRMYQHSSSKSQDVSARTPLRTPCKMSKTRFTSFVLLTAIFISAGPAIVFWVSQQPQQDKISVQFDLSSAVGKWLATDDKSDDWIPQYSGAIAHKLVFRDTNNREVYVYLGMYPRQSQGEELINDLNKISDGKIWHTKYQRAKLVTVGKQQVLEQLLEKNGTQRRVWYWYHIAGRNTVNKYQAKALQVLGLLTGKPWAFVIAVATQTDDDIRSSRQYLKEFVLAIEDPMKNELERVAAHQ